MEREDKNYKMPEYFDVDKLYTARLITSFDHDIEKTHQKYIFELINDDGKEKYREVFTGLIVDKEEYDDYDECFTPISESSGVNLIGDLSKYSLLYILNVINEYSDRLTK